MITFHLNFSELVFETQEKIRETVRSFIRDQMIGEGRNPDNELSDSVEMEDRIDDCISRNLYIGAELESRL